MTPPLFGRAAHGVCDGSYMQTLSTTLGAAAWWVVDPIYLQTMYGTTQTSGTKDDVDPYHAPNSKVPTMPCCWASWPFALSMASQHLLARLQQQKWHPTWAGGLAEGATVFCTG